MKFSESEQKLIQASESDYMDQAQLEFFKLRLTELREVTLNRIDEVKQQMQISPDLSDDSDRASWEEQCAISLRIVDREQKLLPKIAQALHRIRHGTYGYCLETDEPIGVPRLLARPTAEYCADVKQVQEIKEHI